MDFDVVLLRRCLQYLRPLWHRQRKRCRLENVGMGATTGTCFQHCIVVRKATLSPTHLPATPAVLGSIWRGLTAVAWRYPCMATWYLPGLLPGAPSVPQAWLVLLQSTYIRSRGVHNISNEKKRWEVRFLFCFEAVAIPIDLNAVGLLMLQSNICATELRPLVLRLRRGCQGLLWC